MECDRIADETLRADKMDILYGEADLEARRRLEEHLTGCGACRAEMAALRRLRQELSAWRLPRTRPTVTARGILVPRGLAVAAAVLLALGAGLGVAGYASLRRALVVQERATDLLAERQQSAAAALESSLAARQAEASTLDLAALEERLEARIQTSEDRQGLRTRRMFADWAERSEAQRRVDLARVAAGLSYLDGRHGEQVARTNELMGYVLEAATQKR
jgi:anti-sigma factor RsiW